MQIAAVTMLVALRARPPRRRSLSKALDESPSRDSNMYAFDTWRPPADKPTNYNVFLSNPKA